MEDLVLFTLTSYEMMCTFFTPDMHILCPFVHNASFYRSALDVLLSY
jgi:hypothetical protein